jgi:hypothetical protein
VVAQGVDALHHDGVIATQVVDSVSDIHHCQTCLSRWDASDCNQLRRSCLLV